MIIVYYRCVCMAAPDNC